MFTILIAGGTGWLLAGIWADIADCRSVQADKEVLVLLLLQVLNGLMLVCVTGRFKLATMESSWEDMTVWVFGSVVVSWVLRRKLIAVELKSCNRRRSWIKWNGGVWLRWRWYACCGILALLRRICMECRMDVAAGGSNWQNIFDNTYTFGWINSIWNMFMSLFANMGTYQNCCWKDLLCLCWRKRLWMVMVASCWLNGYNKVRLSVLFGYS